MSEIEYLSSGPGDWVLGRVNGMTIWFVRGDVPGCVEVNEEENVLEIVGSEIYDN